MDTGIDELAEAGNTIHNWAQYIANAWCYPEYNNGIVEGKNNRIKTLKRITYGMHCFKNFRTRIMMLDKN